MPLRLKIKHLIKEFSVYEQITIDIDTSFSVFRM